MFKTISEQVSVSPQIGVDDVARAKGEGVTLIVNNRPDGEVAGQPEGAEIAAATEAAGIDYLHIPVTHAGFSHHQVEAMMDALERAEEGRILAFCRSGTRSTLLWSLAAARRGMAPEEIARRAAEAGYDISPVKQMIDAFARAR